MPTDGYFVCINFVIINCKLKGAELHSVPYMMEDILTHILVACEVVDPYVDRFLSPWSSLPIMAKLSGLVLCTEMLLCP